MSLLSMKSVSKRFGNTQALKDVSLTCASGEVRALIGQNGAGKSTLMKILAGAVSADSGTMSVDEAPFLPSSPAEARQQGIAMIYQELALAPHLTVVENIMLGIESTKLGFLCRGEMISKAKDALEELGHGEIDPLAPVSELSISLCQVVEIARAIVSDCKVIVFDEPTSSLSQADTVKLFELVRKLKERGNAVLYISHFLEEIFEIADSASVLRSGECIGDYQISDVEPSSLVEEMVGGEIHDIYSRPATSSDRLLGIGGLVGAGRSELLRGAFGLEEQSVAHVLELPDHEEPRAAWRSGTGFLSEDRATEGLALDLTIAENIVLSSFCRADRSWSYSPTAAAREAEKWINELGIKCEGPRQVVRELSGGNQQKVAIARLLYHGVDLFLLDEPTRGIDAGSKAELYRLFTKLVAEGKKEIVLTSGYLPELLGICNSVVAMHRKRLGQVHPVDEIDKGNFMREVIEGFDE